MTAALMGASPYASTSLGPLGLKAKAPMNDGGGALGPYIRQSGKGECRCQSAATNQRGQG